MIELCELKGLKDSMIDMPDELNVVDSRTTISFNDTKNYSKYYDNMKRIRKQLGYDLDYFDSIDDVNDNENINE